MNTYPLIPSPHRNLPPAGHPRSIRWIMLHTTQNQCLPGVARNIARWFQSAMIGADKKPHPASSHYIVGPDEAIQCVPDGYIAWHARSPANEQALGIELVANAFWTKEQWALPVPKKMLEKAAMLVAEKCVEHNLPPEFRSAAEIKAGVVGITDHHEATLAWHISDHVDVGENFPWAEFLAAVVRNMTPPTE